jgi:RimJ/RimL family protein N-acetyltransferase
VNFKEKIAYLRSNTIRGKTIDLHPYSSKFIDDIIRLRNQDKVKYFLAQPFEITREQQLAWIKGYEERDEEFGFIVCNKRGEVVGISFCYNYDGHSMEIGRATFDTERLMGMPYALETYMVSADIVFEYLQLPTFKVIIKHDNYALLKFYRKLNWSDAGTLTIRDNLYQAMQLQSSESNHKTFHHILERRQNNIS